MPDMFRPWLIAEDFHTITAHTKAALNTDTLPKALKEPVIERGSRLNRTLASASHATIARKLTTNVQHEQRGRKRGVDNRWPGRAATI